MVKKKKKKEKRKSFPFPKECASVNFYVFTLLSDSTASHR